MKHIEKQTPHPNELDNFFLWVESKRDDFVILTGTERWAKLGQNRKRRIQDIILEEQGYICAYCNRRIHKGLPENDEQLRIEHIEPKSIYPDKTFEYTNMVGACYGDQREKNRIIPPRSLHCDVKKDDKEIPKELFPTNENCETNVIYDNEGIVSSNDDIIDNAINDILNLNCIKLTNGRKGILLPLEAIETEQEAYQFINFYRTKNANNEFEPYAGVVISYLRNFFNL